MADSNSNLGDTSDTQKYVDDDRRSRMYNTMHATILTLTFLRLRP